MHKTNLGALRAIVSEFEYLPTEKKDEIITKVNCLPNIMGPDKLIIQRSIGDFYSDKLPKETVGDILRKILSKYENPKTPQNMDNDETSTREVKAEEVMTTITNSVASHKIKLPTSFKKGDVIFFHQLNHPLILLYRKKNSWICTLMTSDQKCPEILCKAESRFFPESYITKTLLTITEVRGKYMFPYDNNKHLGVITEALKKTLF